MSWEEFIRLPVHDVLAFEGFVFAAICLSVASIKAWRERK